jgi:DNA polymerase-3 subunit delta
MILTLSGPNTFLRKQELRSRLAAFLAEHGDMAIERLDGDAASPERMREAVSSLPFLTSRKLVILDEPGKQKAFSEHITDILKAVAETTDVIIHEPKLDKRGTYYKTLKKETDFKEFADLDGSGLARWAAAYIKEQGGSISSADATFLIARVGTDQQLLQHELDKLLVYDSAITQKTIELLTEATPASTVFELLDAAFSGKAKRAFELYQEQRTLKVEPQAIMAMLAWQLHVLALVKAAGDRTPDDMAKASKLNPFVVRKSLGLARRLSLEHIKRLIADLLTLDMRLKRTSLDADEALQLYLLKLAG